MGGKKVVGASGFEPRCEKENERLKAVKLREITKKSAKQGVRESIPKSPGCYPSIPGKTETVSVHRVFRN